MNGLSKFAIFNFVALSVAIFHAYKLNGTFYSSCVYFAQSRLSMILLGSWGLVCMFFTAKIIKDLFFGPLRLIEREHIYEFSWIMISETLLAMTIFKNEIDSTFIFSFALLMICKTFHWILRDRTDFMEQTVQLPKNFIRNVGSLLSVCVVFNSYLIIRNISSVIRSGPSMAILFANEYGLAGISLISTSVRFYLNCMDSLYPDGDNPIENRSSILFYLDFFVDFTKLVIYSFFFFVVMYFYGLPIHIIRDLYVTIISFVRRVRDMINYRLIMDSIETKYPNVTPEELSASADRTCIICREEMAIDIKKLPCGHFFHFKCLKSWLERQQICPTCRKSVLIIPTETKPLIITNTNSIPPSNTNTTGNGNNTTTTTTANDVNTSTETDPNPVTVLSPSTSHRSHRSLPVFMYQNDKVSHSDQEQRLGSVVDAELERFGRRSRSPLHHQTTQHLQTSSTECPLSPLSSVRVKIGEVEDLMAEHRNILKKLRDVERFMKERKFTAEVEIDDDKEGKDSVVE